MTPAQIFSCEFCEIFKTTVFTEHLRATTSDHTLFKRKTSTFRTKTLRINTSEIMVLIKKSRYLPHFLEYRKSNLNGSILGSYKGSLLKLQTSHRRLQTSHRRVQTATDESQTSHRQLQKSHKQLKTSRRRVTNNYRRVTDDYRRGTGVFSAVNMV